MTMPIISLKVPKGKIDPLFIFQSTTFKLMATSDELLSILMPMCLKIFEASSLHFIYPLVNSDFAPQFITSNQYKENPCLASPVVQVQTWFSADYSGSMVHEDGFWQSLTDGTI